MMYAIDRVRQLRLCFTYIHIKGSIAGDFVAGLNHVALRGERPLVVSCEVKGNGIPPVFLIFQKGAKGSSGRICFSFLSGGRILKCILKVRFWI